MKMRASLLAFALVLGAAGCGDRGPRGESPEVRLQREGAFRQACAARLLAQRADSDLQLLESSYATVDPADPVAEISRRATLSAIEFSRAYQRHAELRVSAYAYLDSAVNHAASAADSARYIQRAGSFSPRFPAEGSIEGNVLSSYQANLLALLENVNHPCNWDFPF